jgi:crossover junction endodeoxyribonuclease RuvC
VIVRILGIDPGTLVCGFGVVDAAGSSMKAVAWGAIRVKRDSTFPERLLQVHRGLAGVIAEWKPAAAAVERLFVGKNAQSAMATGEGRGIAVLTAALADLPVFEYTPAEVKKAVTSFGKAHKTQVQEMVRVILGMPAVPTPYDAADALAIAITHAQRAGF